MILRSLLTAWLQNAARAKLQERVAEAVRDQVQGAAAPDEAAPAERPCDVGIVFALGIELGSMEDRLDGVIVTHGGGFVARQGGLKGRHIVLLESGVGREAARHGTEALLLGHHPKYVISAGFAGGLTEDLKRGDVVMADSLMDESGRSLAIDLKVSPESLAGTPGVHVGRILTVDRIVHTTAEKKALGEQHQALAVDMESLAVAEVCSREKARFLAVRIISDAWDDQLPADVDRLLRRKSTVGRLGAAVGAIVNRPSSVKDMLKLKEDALVFSDRLAKFLSSMIVQLVAKPPSDAP